MAEQYGRRLMVGVLEEEAQRHPQRVFALIPASSDLQDGFRQVTFQQVKAAVDHTVYWLQSGFGTFDLHETLSYTGVPDLRYNILFYAALKLRLKVFLPSPRNPPAVNASLLAQTQCTKLVYSPEMAPMVQKLRESVSSLHCLQFPTLDELLTARSLSVPYPLNLDQVRREPILILHSSGSTGIPKPVTMTHGTFATIDNDRNFPSIPGRRNHDLSTWDFGPGSCLYAPFPPFHFAGFCNSILVPVFTKTIPILGPPNRLPSGGLAAQILRSQDVRGCLLAPSTAAALYEEPDGPDLLKRLDVLCYAGGPLPEAIGNELVKHVTLCQFYGSTEVGPVRQLHPAKEHWQFIEFHPLGNHELQPAEDAAFELVVYANEDTEKFSALNHNFPGVREYRTKDLFRPHPTEPGLWKFHARRDDIVVLSSGEKFNPVPTELGVEAVPGVAGALIAGQGRPQVALLVELQPDHGLGPNPVEGLWPWVAKLNANTSGPGRVLKSMILIADPRKPFVRAGKGTVVRKLTLAAYETELNAVFEGSSIQRVQPRVLKPTAFHLDNVKSLVHSITEDALDGQHVNDVENLYNLGLDSVKSLEIIAQLKESLKSHRPEEPLSWLVPEILYNYPTVDELSTVLTQWLNTGAHPKQMDRITKMRDLFSRYEASLQTSSISSQPSNRGETLSVILIGSTGYLGQYLLMSLSQDPNVGRILCLSRSATAHERWAANASTKVEGWQNKISFFQADFTKPAFGVQEDAYEELKECDVILHSAWQVNFALPLDAFTDSISGLLNSIQLATSSKRRPRLLFISSISATGVFEPAGSPNNKIVPEDAVNNAGEAMRTGYGESKHLAEQLIALPMRNREWLPVC